jgi:hypothetical protein
MYFTLSRTNLATTPSLPIAASGAMPSLTPKDAPSGVCRVVTTEAQTGQRAVRQGEELYRQARQALRRWSPL